MNDREKMRRKEAALSHARLRSLLAYHMETGDFWWKIPVPGAESWKPAGSKNDKGYWTIVIDGKKFPAHRLAWFWMFGKWPEEDIDHIDGDRLNNRSQNLREAPRAANLTNRRRHKNNRSGLKGVALHRQSGLYFARIGVGGKAIHLGYFKDPQDAHQAYIAAAKKHYGEFARAG